VRSIGEAYAVSAIAETLPRRPPNSRILRISACPSMPGIATSLTSTWGASFLSAWSASAPQPTVTTLAPHSASTAATLLARPPRSGFTARACRRSSASWASRRKGNKEDFLLNERQVRIFALLGIVFFGVALSLRAQSAQGKKVYMVTDMEGVSGIFDTELQCIPYQSPRFEESRKLLTGEINAAVDGLLEGGATEVVVWDGHDSSRTLSALDIHPRARLLTGTPVSPKLELDSSYSALVFIGQHAMAGAEKGILSHSYSSEGIQNIWVNNKPTGEIGARVMLAGAATSASLLTLTGCKPSRAAFWASACTVWARSSSAGPGPR